MSEIATPTPAAPDAAQIVANAVPESAPQPTEQAVTAADIVMGRSRLPDARPKPAEAPAPAVAQADATGRLHGEDGQFVAKDGETAVPAAEQEGGEPAAAAPGDAPAGEQEPPAADAVPEGFVRIELPENHPLRERGRDHIIAPADLADDYRNLANSPVRRAEVEEAQRQAQSYEQQLDTLQAQIRAAAEFQATLFSDPNVMQTFWGIQTDQGVEAAQQWLQGLVAQRGQNLQRYVEEAQLQRQAARHQQAAEQFLSDAVPQVRTLYPHWSDGEFQRALAGYAVYAQHTNATALTADEFRTFADAWYVKHPAVQQQIAAARTQFQQASEQRAREQLAAQERQRLQQAREIQSTNPMGSVAPHVPADRNSAAAAPEQPTDAQAYLRDLKIR